MTRESGMDKNIEILLREPVGVPRGVLEEIEQYLVDHDAPASLIEQLARALTTEHDHR